MPPKVSLHLPPGADGPGVSAAAFARVLGRAGARRGELALVLVDRRELRRLSRAFRGEDHDTDVLSFDYREAGGRRDGALWGDVYVSADAAREQARERGIPAGEELARLFLHGALHLLGYRDGTRHEAARMEQVQETLLRELLPAGAATACPRPARRKPAAGGRRRRS